MADRSSLVLASADTAVTSPMYKRRKLGILNHIQTLFDDGSESDIKIIALNGEWNLHKVILSQSPYFKTMFRGSWKEKTLNEINLGIEDANITKEALDKTFESLYNEEIQVDPSKAVPVLACAAFFQLDDLINQCAEVMKTCINKDTAIRFYEASQLYGVTEVKNLSFDWLCRNVCDTLHTCPKFLTLISEDLLKELISSPYLCFPGEKDVVSFLISWVFLKEKCSNFHYDSLLELFFNFIHYFEGNANQKPFLETDIGISYQSLFRDIRLKNLFIDAEYKLIEKLNVFPTEWIIPVTQWYETLKTSVGSDDLLQSVSEEVFNQECVRISGFLRDDTDSWRYSYFDFDFDLKIRYGNALFKIKQNLKTEIDSKTLVDFDLRYLTFRVSLFHENMDGGVLSKGETDIKTVSMAPNQELKFPVFASTPLWDSFPIRYRINFLLITPQLYIFKMLHKLLKGNSN